MNDLGGATQGAGRVADHVVSEIHASGGYGRGEPRQRGSRRGGRRIFRTTLDTFGGCAGRSRPLNKRRRRAAGIAFQRSRHRGNSSRSE